MPIHHNGHASAFSVGLLGMINGLK